MGLNICYNECCFGISKTLNFSRLTWAFIIHNTPQYIHTFMHTCLFNVCVVDDLDCFEIIITICWWCCFEFVEHTAPSNPPNRRSRRILHVCQLTSIQFTRPPVRAHLWLSLIPIWVCTRSARSRQSVEHVCNYVHTHTHDRNSYMCSTNPAHTPRERNRLLMANTIITYSGHDACSPSTLRPRYRVDELLYTVKWLATHIVRAFAQADFEEAAAHAGV